MKMSGRCMPPSNGSFMMKTSPGAMSSPKWRMIDSMRGRHRAEMARQGQALRDELAVGIGEARRVVHVVLEHARIGRAEDRQRHLVGDRENGVLEQLEARSDRTLALLSSSRDLLTSFGEPRHAICKPLWVSILAKHVCFARAVRPVAWAKSSASPRLGSTVSKESTSCPRPRSPSPARVAAARPPSRPGP